MNYPGKYTGKYTGKSKGGVQQYKGQSSIVPSFNPQAITTPTTIIPRYSKDHNVAGLIKTKIYLKDRYGNQMTVSQQQEVLNLLNTAQGNWFVGGNQHNKNKGERRK